MLFPVQASMSSQQVEQITSTTEGSYTPYSAHSEPLKEATDLSYSGVAPGNSTEPEPKGLFQGQDTSTTDAHSTPQSIPDTTTKEMGKPPSFFPILPTDLARWSRFGERGGIGSAIATKDVLADNEWEDLMMIKGDQVVVLLQFPKSPSSSEETVDESDLSKGTFLGYCEGVVGKFTGDSVQFLTPKLKKPVITPRATTVQPVVAKQPTLGSSATNLLPEGSLPPGSALKEIETDPIDEPVPLVHDAVQGAMTHPDPAISSFPNEVGEEPEVDPTTPVRSEQSRHMEDKDNIIVSERDNTTTPASTAPAAGENPTEEGLISGSQNTPVSSPLYPNRSDSVIPSTPMAANSTINTPAGSSSTISAAPSSIGPTLLYPPKLQTVPFPSIANGPRIIDTRRMMSRGPQSSSSSYSSPSTISAFSMDAVSAALTTPKATMVQEVPVTASVLSREATSEVGPVRSALNCDPFITPNATSDKLGSIPVSDAAENEGISAGAQEMDRSENEKTMKNSLSPSTSSILNHGNEPDSGVKPSAGMVQSPSSTSTDDSLNSVGYPSMINNVSNGLRPGTGGQRDHTESVIYDSYYSQYFHDMDTTGNSTTDSVYPPLNQNSNSVLGASNGPRFTEPFSSSNATVPIKDTEKRLEELDDADDRFQDGPEHENHENELSQEALTNQFGYGTASNLRDRMVNEAPHSLPTHQLEEQSQKKSRIMSTVYSDLGIPRLNEIFPRSNTADSMSSLLAGSIHSMSTVGTGRSNSPPPFSSMNPILHTMISNSNNQPLAAEEPSLEHSSSSTSKQLLPSPTEFVQGYGPATDHDPYHSMSFTADSSQIPPSPQLAYDAYDTYDHYNVQDLPSIPSTPKTPLSATTPARRNILSTPQQVNVVPAISSTPSNRPLQTASPYVVNPNMHTQTVMESAEVVASRKLFHTYFQAPATSVVGTPLRRNIGEPRLSPAAGLFEGLPPRPPPSPYNYNPDSIRETALSAGLGFGSTTTAVGGLEPSPRRLPRRKSAKGLKISEPQIAMQYYPLTQDLPGDQGLHISNVNTSNSGNTGMVPTLSLPLVGNVNESNFFTGLRAPPSPSSTLNSPSTPVSTASDGGYASSASNSPALYSSSEFPYPPTMTRLLTTPSSLKDSTNIPIWNNDPGSSSATPAKLKKMRSKTNLNFVNNENLGVRPSPNTQAFYSSHTPPASGGRKEDCASEQYALSQAMTRSDTSNSFVTTPTSTGHSPALPSKPSMLNLFGAKRKTSQNMDKAAAESSGSTTKSGPTSVPLSKGISNKDFEDETVQLGNGVEFEIIKPLAIAMLGGAGAGGSSPASGGHGDDVSLNSATTTDSPHTPSSEMQMGGPFSPRSFNSPAREQWDNSHFLVATVPVPPENDGQGHGGPKSQGMIKSSSTISMNRLIPATTSVINDEGSVQDHRARELRWIQTMQTVPPREAKGSKKLKTLVQAGIPSSVRGRVWSYLIESEAFRVEGLFHTLCGCDRVTAYDAIDLEVRQIYNDYPNFEACSVSEADMCTVLQALAQYDFRIGAAPGLAPTVGLLLSHMPAEEVFWIMVALLRSYGFENFLDSEKETLRIDGFTFCLVLESHDVKLFKRLCERDIDVSKLYHSWCRTLFLSTLPWPTALRIVDQLFFTPSLQTTVALAVFDQVRARILSDEFPTHDALRKFLNNLDDSSSNFSSAHFIPKVLSSKVKDGVVRKARKRAEAGVY